MEVIPIQASIQDNGRAYVIIIPKYGGFFNGIAKNKKSATGETFIGRQRMTVITGLIVWIGSNSPMHVSSPESARSRESREDCRQSGSVVSK
jgi:hypothetical protein